MPTKPKAEMTQVTFKLDNEWYRLLAAEAEATGTSANLAAREDLINHLQGDQSELKAIYEQLAAMKSELEQLRSVVASFKAAQSVELKRPGTDLVALRLDLATAVAAILAELRPQESPETIASWVKTNLLRQAA